LRPEIPAQPAPLPMSAAAREALQPALAPSPAKPDPDA
jgi:hypothetical protein